MNFLKLFESNSYKLNTFLPIITGKVIKKDGFVLSNYGVWLKNNYYDKTFKLNILGYRNRLDRYLKQIGEPFLFFDIGANQGLFSLIASQNKHCLNLHLFEPNKNLENTLMHNLEFNRVLNYQIHSYALTNKKGKVPFYIPLNHSGAARVMDSSSNYTYCDSVNRNYLNDMRISTMGNIFLKIDVEGSEDQVLEEFFNSNLKDLIQYIFIELNSHLGNVEKCVDFLLENDFIEVYRKGTTQIHDSLYIKNSSKLKNFK